MNALLNWLAVVTEESTFSGWLLGAKLTLLLALGWAVHAALGRSNPRWRVLLWRTIPTGAALLLLTALMPPLVKCPVLPVLETAKNPPKIPAAPALQQEFSASAKIRSEPESPLPMTSRQFDREQNPAPAVALVAESEVPQTRVDRPRAISGSSAVMATTPSKTFRESRTASVIQSVPEPLALQAKQSSFEWVRLIWCVGSFLATLHMVIGMARLVRICRTAAAVPDWVVEEAATVAQGLRLARRFEIRQTKQLQSPCIVGIFRPLILLPERQCLAEHRDELPAILAHELAHLHGLDVLWNALLNGLSIVLWFHPLM